MTLVEGKNLQNRTSVCFLYKLQQGSAAEGGGNRNTVTSNQ